DRRDDAVRARAPGGRHQRDGPGGPPPRHQGSPAAEAQREGRQGGHPRERQPRPDDPSGLVDRGGSRGGAAARGPAAAPRPRALAAAAVQLSRQPGLAESSTTGAGACAVGAPTTPSIRTPTSRSTATATAKLEKALSIRGRVRATWSRTSRRHTTTAHTTASRAS